MRAQATRSPSCSPASRYPDPSHHLALPYGRSYGGQAVVLARLAGMELLGWQQDMLWDWGALRAPRTEDGEEGLQFAHRICGASIPRQAGKSACAVAWAVFLACGLGMRVLYTAHNYDTTCMMRDRVFEIFGSRAADPNAAHPAMNRAVAEVCHQTAQEYVLLAGGAGVWFSTRTKKAKMGGTFDVVVYDEAQQLTDEQAQVMAPVTASGARGNPQSVYVGTPPRPGGEGTVFEGIRCGVLEGSCEETCWWEWGVSEVGDITDESRWHDANPSLGSVANLSALRMGLGQLTPLAFAQEYLGYWLPQPNQAVVSEADWGACRVEAAPSPPDGWKVAYGVKFSPDGAEMALAGCVHAAGVADHVECIRCGPTRRSLQWLVDWIVVRADTAACVVVDGKSYAGLLCERLEEHRLRRGFLVRARVDEVTTASSTMVEAIAARTVTHIGQPALDASVLTATRRKIGSNGGWGWGGDGSCAIEAASLALWGARNRCAEPTRKLRMG